jgi:murein DD-endopeptidase MepM/ murein hydrolase activator NlpD
MQPPVAPAPSTGPVPGAAQPMPVQPFSQLIPVAIPVPSSRHESAPPVEEARPRRRTARGAISMLAVFALAVLWGLPAFASEALAAPPVGGVEDGSADVQQLSVGGVEVDGASADGISGAAAATRSAPVAAAPSWLVPVAGRLGDPYGPRPEQPVPGVALFHRGQDIVAPCGAPIRAAASGVVKTATYWGTYGNWILVDHGDGVAVGYAHESRIMVSVGQRVTAGQVIGLVGQTGAATGCHLHLEVHLNGTAVNPVPFFIGKGVPLG